MGNGLQPNAAWYVCAGAVMGTVLGTTLLFLQTSEFETQLARFDFGLSQSEIFDAGVPEVSEFDLAPIVIESDGAPTIARSSLTVRRGDTLLGLLRQRGIGVGEAHAIAQSMSGTFDPRDIRVGQNLDISISVESPTTDPELDALRIKIAPGHDVVVIRLPDGGYSTQAVIAETSLEPQVFRGVIETSLYEAAVGQGVPPQILVEMIRLFSYDVDFQRDIRNNDEFEIMFDRHVTEDGLVVANGDIEYASMVLRGKPLKIYAYQHDDGIVDHYNEQGKGIRKALMRTPINGARLSSSYGRRKHPILGYTKMHRGVDFAAPHGTPIYAADDGVIEKRHRWGGFGNYVGIRHGDGFSTAYAHLRSFAKGQKVGRRVRQGDVIGYVGSTGRSTGPHLHYEVHRNGAQVNPMKVRFPASKTLSGRELEAFQKIRSQLDAKWVRRTQSQELALFKDEIDANPVE